MKIQVQSVCPKCGGRGIVKNGGRRRGKVDTHCEGRGEITRVIEVDDPKPKR